MATEASDAMGGGDIPTPHPCSRGRGFGAVSKAQMRPRDGSDEKEPGGVFFKAYVIQEFFFFFFFNLLELGLPPLSSAEVETLYLTV